MSNQYPPMSVMKILKSRLHKAKVNVRQYMIEESIIDSSTSYKDTDYHMDLTVFGNREINRQQRDIVQLEFLIEQLKTIL